MDDGYADEALRAAIVMRRPFLSLFLQVVLLLAACSPSHEVGHRSRSAVLLAGAKNVEYGLLGAEESIAYDLAPTTIEATRQMIDRELRADGWTAETFGSSRPYVDGRTGTREPVEQWHGTWRRGESVAEYILERRPDRLHVWGRVGPPDAASATTPAMSNTVAPSIAQPDARSVEAGSNDVVMFCGPQGTTAVALTNVTEQTATASWRFRDSAGHESSAQATVRERPGSKPKNIDASGAHFQAGPYTFTWSPAEITMTGSRTKPQTVVAATSWIYYPAELRATKLSGKSLNVVDLSTACR
jgi:hypothetical protein